MASYNFDAKLLGSRKFEKIFIYYFIEFYKYLIHLDFIFIHQMLQFKMT